jgi:enamine deaminase RidA (YjgF/YER057c/UK114 family)
MIDINLNVESTKTLNVFKPTTSSNFEIELADCINQIKRFIDNSSNQILKMQIYFQYSNENNYEIFINEINSKIFSLLISQNFPIVYIPQYPADNSKINISVTSINPKKVNFDYKYLTENNYSYYKLTIEDSVEIYGTIFDIGDNSNVYNQSIECFKTMKNILNSNNLDLDDVVRQWMYIGGINKHNNLNNKQVENYQMFNSARAIYYSEVNWKNGYPSATAIGMDITGCIIEFTAIKPTDKISIIPLQNPRQIDAHKYTDKYIPINSEVNSPKFERGKIVLDDKKIDIYISGTASILGEDSINDDITKQTNITLDNIAILSSKQNISSHNVNIQNNLPNFSGVCVYIKKKSDAEKAIEICNNHFGTIPIIYVIADVCREELLIEIEAFINAGVE